MKKAVLVAAASIAIANCLNGEPGTSTQPPANQQEVKPLPLYQLMKKYVEEKDLTSALAVAKSIDAIGGDSPISTAVSPVGKWYWENGTGPNALNADHTVGANGDKGKWHWTQETDRRLEIDWKGGFIDSATLSADGARMQVSNQLGSAFTARRAGDTPKGNTAPAANAASSDDGSDNSKPTAGHVPLNKEEAATPAGRWLWHHNPYPVVIGQDMTVGANGKDGTWRWVDQAHRQFEIDWKNGYIDQSTLAEDGERIDILNNTGEKHFALRLPRE